MKAKTIAITVAGIFASTSPVLAAEGFQWSGSVSLGAGKTNGTALDPSKLNEYRDLGSSTAPLSMFDLKGRGDEYYVNAFGENIGRDDMFLDLKGGRYGIFKYQLYENDLRHNLGSGLGALSPFSGIGGNTLTMPLSPDPASVNPQAWNSFDHSYKRRDFGGMFEFSNNTPWYIRTDYNEVKRNGINVFAGAQGTSPGFGNYDLPAPINYDTKTYSAEVGYSSKKGHAALNLTYSDFSNGNAQLNWSNYNFNGTDVTYLPPSNNMFKLSGNANMRDLPGNSIVAGRFTYSKLENDVAVPLTGLTGGLAGTGAIPLGPFGVNAPTNPNSPNFHGEVVKKSVSLSLTSHPVEKLDTKAYWNWYDESNRSTHMVYSPGQLTTAQLNALGVPTAGLTAAQIASLASRFTLLAGGTGANCNYTSFASATAAAPCSTELFGVRKYNLGVEAGYRLNPDNKVSVGFDWNDIERERYDFRGTIDRKAYTEWKNSTFDALTARIKYQFLQRRSDFSLDPNVVANNPTDFYVRRFDFANVNQNMVKLTLDSTPRPLLDLGFEAIYKTNNFLDTPLGRTDDKRQEYYASIAYGDPKSFRMMLFGDVEIFEYNSRHRAGGSTLQNADPSAPPTPTFPQISTVYSWTAKNLDKNWQVGLGSDWTPVERFTMKASLLYAQTNGSVDFAALGDTQITRPGFVPITNFDNTRRTSLNLKGTYRFAKQFEMTGGYSFERYRYSDIAYDNNAYVVSPAASTTTPPSCGANKLTCASYFTGQYAYQPYTANIFYIFGTYKF